MFFFNNDLPGEYRCVRTRPWDSTAWVFFIIRELCADKLISGAEFCKFTNSLENPEKHKGDEAQDSDWWKGFE